MAEKGGPTFVAEVATITPTGVPAATDLSAVRATNIEVKFREALPGEMLPTAEHAYIEISRANGEHQVIGAYPVGGFPQTQEGGQLQFRAGNEHPTTGHEEQQRTRATTELTVPPGVTLTQYANELVDGAKAYNRHAVRYDGIGEDGYNSNAFVSSLIVAKGGATGRADVERIASVVDTSPVRYAGQHATMNDEQMANLVKRDYDSWRLVAAGFGNATMDPERFSSDRRLAAEKAPLVPQIHDGQAAVSPLFAVIAHIVENRVGAAMAPPHDAAARPAALPGPTRAHDGSIEITYDGKPRNVGPGFAQGGTITDVRDGIVTQRSGKHTVSYHMADLTADARDAATMEREILPGRRLEVSVGKQRVHVTSLERNHDVDLIQTHGFEPRGR